MIVFSVGENKYEQMSNIRRLRHVEVYGLNSVGIRELSCERRRGQTIEQKVGSNLKDNTASRIKQAPDIAQHIAQHIAMIVSRHESHCQRLQVSSHLPHLPSDMHSTT